MVKPLISVRYGISIGELARRVSLVGRPVQIAVDGTPATEASEVTRLLSDTQSQAARLGTPHKPIGRPGADHLVATHLDFYRVGTYGR